MTIALVEGEFTTLVQSSISGTSAVFLIIPLGVLGSLLADLSILFALLRLSFKPVLDVVFSGSSFILTTFSVFEVYLEVFFSSFSSKETYSSFSSCL